MLRQEGSILQPTGTIEPFDSWHYVGASGQPAFENSWGNYDATYGPTRFIKTASGVVYIEGLVSNGTISTTLPVFTLPVGYRPTGPRLIRPTISNSALGRLDVTNAGLVIPYSGNNAWYSVWTSFYVG